MLFRFLQFLLISITRKHSICEENNEISHCNEGHSYTEKMRYETESKVKK